MTETSLFLAIIAVAMIVFDVYIIAKKGKSESISAYVIKVVNRDRMTFFLVLCLGIVLGHLFWSMPTESIYDNVECTKIKDSNGN